MRGFPILVCVLFGALMFPTVTAGHCSPSQASANAFSVGEETIYVTSPGDGTHVYRESNGLPGLQREDAEQDTACHVTPDARIV